MADLSNTLQALAADTAAIVVSELDTAHTRALLDDITRADRVLTALKVRAGQHCDHLSSRNRGPDANDAFHDNSDVSSATARRNAARSRIVDDIPDLGPALDNGTISGEHLDAIARAANNLELESRPLFDAAAADLVNRTNNQPVDTFAKNVRRIANRIADDHGRAKAVGQRQASSLSLWTDRNGMGHIRGSFDPEWFASVKNGIEREASAMAASASNAGEPITKGRHLDAAALVELIQHGNGAKGRPEILVIIDADSATSGPHEHATRETRDGSELSHDTITRLGCDALIRRVVLDADGVVIDVGRQHRTATKTQWVALNAMYAACAWQGCDRPVSWCQAHHIHEWNQGGATNLDNLVPLCSTHHHRVHEGQWAIKLLPDRTLRIFRPDGTHHGNTRPDRFDPSDERKPCTN